jgi:CDP-4-dehydro-6-deoxyglucose reductase, E3
VTSPSRINLDTSIAVHRMPVVTLSNHTCFDSEPGTSVLDAALARGVVLEHSCRTGRCGSCKARVVHGKSTMLRDATSLTTDESDRGWILTCVSEALTDLQLDIEDLGALAGLQARVTPARIERLTLLTPDVMEIELRLPPRASFEFLAGQYVDVTGPTGIRRSYSIASSSAQNQSIRLQIRRMEGGALSAYWFEQAKINDLLRFNGPRGTFYLRPSAGLDLVFLATGTGIAPICSMLAQLAAAPAEEQPRSVTLYWGGRHGEDLYTDPSTLLPSLRYVAVLSRGDVGWHGASGHVQDVLAHEVAHGRAPALAGCAVYACGSERMIHGSRRLLTDLGLPGRRFYSDAFVSSN